MVTKRTLELSVAATPSSVQRVRREVAEAAATAGMKAAAVDDVRLCVNEAVANAVLHAYDGGPGVVEVVVETDDERLHVVVRDRGAGLKASSPSGRNGYGLRLMDALSERCSITSRPGAGTEVRLAFALGAPAHSAP